MYSWECNRGPGGKQWPGLLLSPLQAVHLLSKVLSYSTPHIENNTTYVLLAARLFRFVAASVRLPARHRGAVTLGMLFTPVWPFY